MHSTAGSYEGRPCRAKMIGLTASWQMRSTFTHGRLRKRAGGFCLTDLTFHFAMDRSQNTFHLTVWLPEIKGGCRASGESRNPLSPADRSEGRGGGPMAELGMLQLLPNAAAALIYLVVFVSSHNKLTAIHTLHILYIVYFRADTREVQQWFTWSKTYSFFLPGFVAH